MIDRETKKYVDHPAPSPALMILLIVVLGALLVSIPAVIEQVSASDLPWAPIAVLGITFLIVCFYFWPLVTTYYTLTPEGLLVRYGPWRRQYTWSEFLNATWQRGMFATRIGWPSVTPCVRLTDAVLLRRRGKFFGLYLTPNDTKAFLKRITELAPDLTREAIY